MFLHQQKIGFLELNGKRAQHNDLKIGLKMTDTTPKQARGLAKRTEEGARHISVETCDALRSLADQLEAVTAERDSYKLDADRYRWLRAGDYSIALSRSILNDTPHGVDATIDAAIAKEAK